MLARWKKVVERRGQSVLISSYFYNGIQTKYFREIGLWYGLDNYMIIDFSGYYLADEAARCQNYLRNRLRRESGAFIETTLNRLVARGEKLLDFAKRVGQRSRLGDNIFSIFYRFSELCLEFGPAMYFPILSEPAIEEAVRSLIKKRKPADAEHIYEVFTSSVEPTAGSYELASLHRIAIAYKRSGRRQTIRLMAMLDDHLARYGWLAFTKFVGRPWTKRTLLARISHLLRDKSARGDSKILDQYRQRKRETATLVRQLKLSGREQGLIRSAQQLAYFRTWRVDVYTQAGYRIRNLLYAIARRVRVSPREVVWMTYKEIKDCLSNGKTFPVVLGRHIGRVD